MQAPSSSVGKYVVAAIGFAALLASSFMFYTFGYSFDWMRIEVAWWVIMGAFAMVSLLGVLAVVRSLRKTWKDALLFAGMPLALFVIGLLAGR